MLFFAPVYGWYLNFEKIEEIRAEKRGQITDNEKG